MPPEETDENIDKNVQLPPGEPILPLDKNGNPWRAQHGDFYVERDLETQAIRYAQSLVRNILNYLWNSGFIEDQHHNDGCIFEAWRAQHRVAMGQGKAVSGELDDGTAGKLRAYGYVLIVHRLSPYALKAITQAIDVFANHSTERQAFRNRLIYREAFQNLSRVMVPVRERITYLEGLSEEARNALSDEALKNLLAQRTENA